MAINFRNTIFKGVAARQDQCPDNSMPEIVMSGRSNVGKSSLINALSGQNKLARVSNTPGKTRMVIYFEVDKKFFLTDLPGYGYAKVSKAIKAEFSQLVDQYLSSGRNLALVLHLMDVRHKPNQQDLQMIDWLASHQIPWQIILTKCDKLSRAQLSKQMAVFKRIPGMEKSRPPLAFSATSKQGLQDLRRLLAGVFDEVPLETD